MTTTNEITTLKGQVERCLEHDPKTRNGDIDLTICVRQKFYGINRSIELGTLFDLPSQDSIKRVRARIQNQEQKFLPTSRDVAKKRKVQEGVRRESMIRLIF